MNLNKLKDKVYKNAVAHGWHDENYSNAHWLCLVVAELMEAIEADRNSKYAYRKEFEEIIDKLGKDISIKKWREAFEMCIKDRLEDELADACIRLLDFAGLKELELTYTNGFAIMNMTFTEYIFCLCSFISNPDKSNVEWLDNHVSYSLGWIFSWCRAKNIDIEWHILQKMKYNRHRPYKHGNKKY
jgi:hypothetical protein